MRKTILGVVALAAVSATPAYAGVTSTSYLTPPSYSPDSTLITFDGALPTGFSLNGGQILNTSTSTGAYQGSLAPAGSSGSYLAVGATSGTQAVLKGTGNTSWGSVSLLWGSIDSFNKLDVLDTLGNVIKSLTGNDVTSNVTATGTATDNNRYVTYTVDPNSGTRIGGLRFNSPTDAFEIDNVAFSQPTPVPEPSTIALFALGLLGVFALRRRTASAKSFAL